MAALARAISAAMVLVCVGGQQTATIAAQVIAARRTSAAALALHQTEHEAKCQCGSGAHATCPMHRRAHSSSPGESGRSHWCTGCDHQKPVVLTVSSADVASLPLERYQPLAPTEASLLRLASSRQPRDGTHRPPVPPPRS